MPTARREERAGVKRAERRFAEFRKQAASLAASLEERRTPFSALAQRWLRIHNVHLKPSSADRNARCVKELNMTFGKLAVSEITTRHCEDWRARRGTGIAASTFNKDALALRAVADYAQRDGGDRLEQFSDPVRLRSATTTEVYASFPAAFLREQRD